MNDIAMGALSPAARAGLAEWRRIVSDLDMASVSGLLAEDVRFRSPFVWRPYDGKATTAHILTTVANVFQDFQYLREFQNSSGCVLEFSARVRDRDLVGVDVIEFDMAGKIVDFEVIVRPANALQILGDEMATRLASSSGPAR